MSLATSIVVMEGGDLVQMAPPLDVYHRPSSLFVARFVGNPPMNVFTPAEHAALSSWTSEIAGLPSGAASIGIRPEAIRLHAEPGSGRIEAVVDSVQPTGAECITALTVDGRSLFALGGDVPPVGEGERVYVALSPRGVHAFGHDDVTLSAAAHA
jgi:ABC-type sugar transport system ATPase subunit